MPTLTPGTKKTIIIVVGSIVGIAIIAAAVTGNMQGLFDFALAIFESKKG